LHLVGILFPQRKEGSEYDVTTNSLQVN